MTEPTRIEWLEIGMDQSASSNLQKQLCFAVYSASHAFTRAYRALLEPLGLTYPQYLVLLILWERDGMRVKELGRQLFLDSGTLTPLLKRLEGLGYISRNRDSADERQVTITLTSAGRQLEGAAAPIPRDISCMTQLDEATMKDLVESVARLRGNLQDAADHYLAAV